MRKILLCFSLWIGLSGISHALVASDIDSRARIYLKDQSSVANRQQFSDAFLLNLITDGQREANATLWLTMSSSTFNLTPGATEYVLPTDFMFTYRVTLNGQKVTMTSYDYLDSNSLGWSTAAGQPTQYYINNFSPSPTIGFVPAPVSGSTGTVLMFYANNTPDVTQLSQTLYNGWVPLGGYQQGLVDFVVCHAWQVLEEMDDAKPFCDRWAQYMTLMRNLQTRTPDFNPGAGGRRNQ
jgi:hypothetical protein